MVSINKEFVEFVKMNEKDLKKSIDNLKGTEFLDAFCVIQHIKAFEQENKQLKEQIEKLEFKLDYEKENLRFSKDYADCLEKKVKQRDEVIDEAINKLGRYADEMVNNGNAYAICVDLLDTLKKYKGDNNE